MEDRLMRMVLHNGWHRIWNKALGAMCVVGYLSGFLPSETAPVWGAVQAQGLQEETVEYPDPQPPGGQAHSVPFAGYEESLRSSERWQSMNPEEQEQAIQKIKRMRQQFLERQRQLQMQYQGLKNIKAKPRESLMSKRRKWEGLQESGELWSQFQALPLPRRLELEKSLGLTRISPSQRQKTFHEKLNRLPFSKRETILRELEHFP